MKKVFSQIFKFSIVFGLFLFSGCAKYKPRPLFECKGLAQEKDNLVLKTAKLSKDECDFAFDGKLSSPKLKPIQIMVQNKGTEPVELRSSRISLDLEMMRTLKNTAHFNTPARALGYGLLGIPLAYAALPFWLWPASLIPGHNPAYVTVFGLTLITFPVFSFIGGLCNSSINNSKMDKDFAKRTIVLGSKITIAPATTMNRVMFVAAESYADKYDIEFVNAATQQVTAFNCTL